MPTSRPTDTATNERQHLGVVLLVLCGAIFLDSLDVSMTGIALPAIRQDLSMSTGSLQWIVSAYVLGYGGFLLLGGRAADLFGRRRVFLVSLAVFLVASGLGAVASDGSLLIATRFIKGVAAAFTAPAALSIITTTFAEGHARNRALAFFTATGASGFSLGLVLSGVLTGAGWRWVFVFPVAVALVVLAGATRYVPSDTPAPTGPRKIDVAGAITLTAGTLTLVLSLVDAPTAGWDSPGTLATFAVAIALLAAFVAIEQRVRTPLVRLGIFRSGALVRANLGALCLFGGWVGFMFVTPLYLRLLGWSSVQSGLAIFPSGVVVVALAPRIASLIARFGTARLIAVGLGAHVAAYALYLRIGADATYVGVVLPTVLLGGLGFALAYGPLNVAGTAGVAPSEQGLAGGLVTSSMQFGGALVLAIAIAVEQAVAGDQATPEAALSGFRAAIAVSLVTALAGLAVTVLVPARRRRGAPAPEAA
jgi:MFS family permease